MLRPGEEYRMRIVAQVVLHLAGLTKEMGEEAFTAAWQQAFPDQEPPLAALRDALRQLEHGSD